MTISRRQDRFDARGLHRRVEHRRARMILAVAACAVTGLVGAACGSDSSKPGTVTTTSPSAPTSDTSGSDTSGSDTSGTGVPVISGSPAGDIGGNLIPNGG